MVSIRELGVAGGFCEEAKWPFLIGSMLGSLPTPGMVIYRVCCSCGRWAVITTGVRRVVDDDGSIYQERYPRCRQCAGTGSHCESVADVSGCEFPSNHARISSSLMNRSRPEGGERMSGSTSTDLLSRAAR